MTTDRTHATHERTRDITIMEVSYSDDDRYLKPTRKAIDDMKKSLQSAGQVSPIGVYPITTNKYRLVFGATRFVAAMELGWKTILASIFSGHPDEYRMLELTENVERRDITGEQRKAMKAEIKALQSKRLAEVEPSKGGRGNKGGLSDEARQMGVPRATAQRRQEDAKPAHLPQSGRVSDEASGVSQARKRRRGHAEERPVSVTATLSVAERAMLTEWEKRNNMNTSRAVRTMILDYLARDKEANRPLEAKAS